ncbi:hypothetical protein RCL_jg14505.t1 [Rhizophagus clarus]|uniref:Uncharacterized protein n=1 Tax=Rhizophagus clarus TaxID=94130 RepID=A0A8H3LWZ5_9GLOM|nr:hypothetical protein RCL_jg14505.t1 [Rhizophagus clarus]
MNLPNDMIATAFFLKENLTKFLIPLRIKAFKEVKNLNGTYKMINYFKLSCQQAKDPSTGKANNKLSTSTSKSFKTSESNCLVATGFNCIFIRSLKKDSGKSSTRRKADEKIKIMKTTKKQSKGPSFLKKLSKKQLHAKIMEIKKVLIDFI